MSPSKEPNYFTRVDKGVDYYRLMFKNAGATRYRGESSTGYMVSPTAIRKIKALVPDPRFVFILRNPIDRAWSHYTWVCGRHGRRSQSFREAFLGDSWQSAPDPMPVDRGYFHTGLYARWLELYLDAFGAERITVEIFEDFIRSPLEGLNRIFRFLDLESIEKIQEVHVLPTEQMRFPRLLGIYSEAGRVGGRLVRHLAPLRLQLRLIEIYKAGDRQLSKQLSAGRPAPLDDETRAWLAPFYEESVAALRALTGLRLDPWKPDFPPVSASRPYSST